MATRNQQLRDVIAGVLTLARELRKGTIERVLEMSAAELRRRSRITAPVGSPRLDGVVPLWMPGVAFDVQGGHLCV
jgi:hypothetical protein